MAQKSQSKQTSEEPEVKLDTTNEFAVTTGKNLPNHSASMNGFSHFVRIVQPYPTMRTRQAAYRLAAHLIQQAQVLPNEEIAAPWDDVLDVILEETSTVMDTEEEE